MFLFPDHFDFDNLANSAYTDKGGWMNKESFIEQVVFDLRKQ